MADSDFSTLLQAAEQLTTEIEGNEELPRVERSLSQVLEASQELYSRVTKTGAHDIQAHLLLGSKGINLPQISQKLETLSSKRTFEPLQPIADSDIESFLRNEQENAILSLINEVNKNSIQTIEEQKWDHMLSDWNKEKVKLMSAMIGPSQNWLDLKKCPEQPAILDTPRRFGHSMLNDQETAYAKQVYQYNKLIFQGTKSRMSLDEKFSQAAEDFNDPKVKEMWAIIKTMANFPPLARDEDPLKSRGNSTVQRALVSQGKKYLENRYKTYMTTIVVENLQAAMRGGAPGTYHLVKSYVGLRLKGQNFMEASDGLIDGRPLWPMVYYCLRSGDPHAALHCMKQSGPGNEDFIEVLEEYIKQPDLPLNNKLQTSINFQYRIHVRNVTDPYKRAVYCVIGCCDVSDEHPEVAKTADDYLWLKLSLIKDRGSANEADSFTYSDLQKMILEEYGETHYKAYEQPMVYFQVLALTGQFEPAIEFLSRVPRYQVHGVHMALALNELYLLGTPRNVQAPLLSVDTEDPIPLRRLNLARLLMLYVRKFELTDPAEALHYFYFLRNLKDPMGRNLFMCCCADLVLESRDYDTLFGRLDPVTGLRTHGLLDQFNTPQIDSKVIAANVAENLVNKGLFEDAISMFDISGNLEKCVELSCVLLGQVVDTAGGEGLRARLVDTATRIADRVQATGTVLPPPLHHAFTTLCKLMTFFQQYRAENYDAAMQTLSECALVPLSAGEVQARVAAARDARGELLRTLPAVLRAAAALLLHRRRRLPAQLTTRPDGDKQLEFLREQAEALTTFAGNIQYTMPGDTYSQLAQMQILLH